jgi:gamma-glutamylcyclotransferase (GGCT)/AIG2-like uncharacterized protein YtfP
MNRLLIAICSISLILTACKDEVPTTEKTEKRERLDQLIPAYPKADSYEKQIQTIDSDKDLFEAKSLSYMDNDGNIESVTALIDSTYQFSKLIHYLTETDGRQVETHFYFKGSQLFSSVQTMRRYTKRTSFSKEVKTYYNSENVVVYTAERKATGENDITKSSYLEAEKRLHNPSKALEIINQKGKFQTNFLGFNESRGKIFLIIGTEFYNSTVVIPGFQGILKTLKNNESSYLNKSLKIEFKEVTELDGFSYQALLDIKLL